MIGTCSQEAARDESSSASGGSGGTMASLIFTASPRKVWLVILLGLCVWCVGVCLKKKQNPFMIEKRKNELLNVTSKKIEQ